MEDNQNQDRLSAMVRYLSGTMTEDERRRYATKVSSDAELKQELEAFTRIWSDAKSASRALSPDTEIAIGIVKSRIHQPMRLRKWLPRVAAVLLLGVVVTVAGIRFVGQSEIIAQTKQDEQRHHMLPDGSEVWLAEGTILRYPKKWQVDHRDLSLDGKAFFNVIRDTTRAFVIHGSRTDVSVLGTSFQYISRNDQSSVSVANGLVRFSHKVDTAMSVLVRAGEGAELLKTTGKFIKASSDANEVAWATGKLVFRDTPLQSVIPVISEYYGVQFSLSNHALGNCRLSTTFQNMPLEEVLGELELILSMDISSVDDLITLNGAGCE